MFLEDGTIETFSFLDTFINYLLKAEYYSLSLRRIMGTFRYYLSYSKRVYKHFFRVFTNIVAILNILPYY